MCVIVTSVKGRVSLSSSLACFSSAPRASTMSHSNMPPLHIPPFQIQALTTHRGCALLQQQRFFFSRWAQGKACSSLRSQIHTHRAAGGDRHSSSTNFRHHPANSLTLFFSTCALTSPFVACLLLLRSSLFPRLQRPRNHRLRGCVCGPLDPLLLCL